MKKCHGFLNLTTCANALSGVQFETSFIYKQVITKKQEKKSDKVELESENDISEVDVDVFEIVPVARPVVAKKVVQPAISFDVSGVELNMTPDEVNLIFKKLREGLDFSISSSVRF